MAPSMPRPALVAACRRSAVLVRATLLLLYAAMVVAACAAPTRTPSPTQAVTPTPEPTAQPTPVFTNAPDPELAALIPNEVAGATVHIPAVTEFSVTPGDIGEVYGQVGARFRMLQLAYVSQPRLSLFAMRMSAPFATTADLEPYLAEAARYVGIAGLHREAWTLQAVAGHLLWIRPEDGATLKGTRLYTWAADGLVFLLIGVDEAQNLAMVAGLPGEPAPTPSPLPSTAGSASSAPSPTGS